MARDAVVLARVGTTNEIKADKSLRYFTAANVEAPSGRARKILTKVSGATSPDPA